MKPNEVLIEFGFTALEADVYVFLLGESPVSGYRIAQSINKPVANTYKALQSLAHKGAVLIEEGDYRACSPVPLEELLGRLDRQFKDRMHMARESLSAFQPTMSDHRIYQLKSKGQVFDRAAAMLAQATHVVLVDAFPIPLEMIRNELARAASRGLVVGIKAYKSADISGALLSVLSSGDEVLRRWPCQWFNMVVDGRCHMMVLMDKPGEKILQAVWSESPYLSWIYHSALSNEIRMAAIMSILSGPVDVEDVRKVIKGLEPLVAKEAPGYFALKSLISPRST